jgi:hypothetical protein
VNLSAGTMGEVPTAVVTVTSTVPYPGAAKGEAGAASITILPEASVVTVAGLPVPKSTAVAEPRPAPVIVTLVPVPVGSADAGVTALIEGAGAAAAGDTPTAVNATPREPRNRAIPRAVFENPTSERVLRFDLTGFPSPSVDDAPKAC